MANSLEVKRLKIERHHLGKEEKTDDSVIVEAPLQISLRYGKKGNRNTFTFAITMRTPGDDVDLVYGYLYSEQVITHLDDIVQLRHISDEHIMVELGYHVEVQQDLLVRNTLATSSCGACGKTSVEQLQLDIPWVLSRSHPILKADIFKTWLAILNNNQSLFHKTGGNHAVALFCGSELISLKEDVGRHNAMDKLTGAALRNGLVPLDNYGVLVSGRASFELVQKALSAGVPVLAAVGAPSSLAIELASDYNMTLIGFLKEDNFNLYTGSFRIN